MKRFSLFLFLNFLMLQSCTTQKSVVQSHQSTNVTAKAPVDTVTYDKASPFVDGFARVEKDSSSFYIDKKGRYAFDKTVHAFYPLDSVVPDGYGRVSLHKNKKKLMRIVETKTGKYGMTNKQGKWIFKPDYDTIAFKFNRYVELKKDGKMTYASSHGKLLVPLKFDSVGIMDGDYYDVKKNGKWGVVDFNNNVLIPFKYEHSHFNMRSGDWVTTFQKKGKSVVINIPQQKEYGAPEYSSAEIVNGLLVAKKNGKVGLINSRGKKLADFVYDDIWNSYGTFENGPYLIVEKNDKYGIIDTLGHTIIPPEYPKEVYPRGGYFVFEKNGQSGLLNAKNKVILPAKYKRLHAKKLQLPDESEITVFELSNGKKYGFFYSEDRGFSAAKI